MPLSLLHANMMPQEGGWTYPGESDTDENCHNPHHRIWLYVRILIIPKGSMPTFVKNSILQFSSVNIT